VHLVKPAPNFSEQAAADAGFLERAERHGVTERVLGANLLPHGGGYLYPQYERVVGVVEDGPDARRFEILRTDGEREHLEHPRGQTYVYRGNEVLERMNALSLGESVLEMEVKYILRDKPMPGAPS